MRKNLIVFFLLMIPLIAFAGVVYYGSGKAVFLEDVLELKSGNQFSADGTNFSLNTAKLTNVVDPTLDQDAATKKYVDDEVSGSGGANIELDNLGTTAVNTDVIPDATTHDLGTTLLPWQNVYQRGSFYYLAGSSIGSISGSGSDLNIVSTSGGLNLVVDDLTFIAPAQIKNVSDPTDAQDVVTKNYLENNPSGLPVLGKGSLITSNGTVNGELTKCPDGEFLIWDDAETAGMKCSGSLSYGPDIDATYTGILHINKGTSSAAAAGVFMYPDGGTGYDAYMYKNADNILYIGSNLAESIKFTADGSSAMTINGNKSVTIHETGGNGGNVPHNCVRSSATHSAASYIDYTCPEDKILTGGGCTLSQPYINGYPLSSTVYRCTQSIVSAIGAFGICCDY